MTDTTIQAVITQTVALIHYYGFDTGRYTAVELVAAWLERYPPIWVRFAAIEALYQGRYKAVSVEQILQFWVRRGQPSYHFNHEFESLICRKLPPFPQHSADRERLEQWMAAIAQTEGSFELEETLASPDPAPQAPEETQTQESQTLSQPLTRRPIHKFTPPEDGSGFYDKLKEVFDNQEGALELEESK